MIILNLVLIPFLGAVGTGIAAFVSQGVMGFLQYFEVRNRMKHDVAPGTWNKLIFLMFALGAILAVQLYFNFNPLLFILTLGIVWVVLVFGLKIIDVVQFIGLLKQPKK